MLYRSVDDFFRDVDLPLRRKMLSGTLTAYPHFLQRLHEPHPLQRFLCLQPQVSHAIHVSIPAIPEACVPSFSSRPQPSPNP